MRVADLGRQIVERRLQTLEYIKRVYAGECHWLSVALLPSSDEANKQLDKQAKDAETAQALRWFYLGVSIAPLLPVPEGPIFVRALLQHDPSLYPHRRCKPLRNQRATLLSTRQWTRCRLAPSSTSVASPTRLHLTAPRQPRSPSTCSRMPTRTTCSE